MTSALLARRKSAQQKRDVAAGISAFLLLIGLLGLIVGLHELRLRNDPGRVTAVGAVLVVASLIVCWAGVMLTLFTFNRVGIQLWSGRLVLAACWLIVIGAISLGIAEWRSLDVDPLIVSYAVTVALLALAAFVFLHQLTEVALGQGRDLLARVSRDGVHHLSVLVRAGVHSGAQTAGPKPDCQARARQPTPRSRVLDGHYHAEEHRHGEGPRFHRYVCRQRSYVRSGEGRVTCRGRDHASTQVAGHRSL